MQVTHDSTIYTVGFYFAFVVVFSLIKPTDHSFHWHWLALWFQAGNKAPTGTKKPSRICTKRMRQNNNNEKKNAHSRTTEMIEIFWCDAIDTSRCGRARHECNFFFVDVDSELAMQAKLSTGVLPDELQVKVHANRSFIIDKNCCALCGGRKKCQPATNHLILLCMSVSVCFFAAFDYHENEIQQQCCPFRAKKLNDDICR